MSRLKRLYAYLKATPAWFALSGAESHLGRAGWFTSRSRHLAVDNDGNPLPWITYPSLCFLEPRVREDMTVFEFGSGASTLWWARRVRHVVSCEHDRSWFERTRAVVPSNVHMIHSALEGQQYAGQALQYKSAFDIVVIDGRDRVNCARNSLPALKSDGVIVWDNSDRDEYRNGYDFLRENGFRRIDFTGMGPINVYAWSTSIFYREQNCLGV